MWLLWILLAWWGNEEPRWIRIEGRAQGTTYMVRYHGSDSTVVRHALDSLFRQVDASLSLYDSNSLISRFNREGRVLMDGPMRDVVSKAMAVNQASEGCFDITVRNLSLLWKNQEKGQWPSKAAIRRALRLTGTVSLNVRGDSLFASRPGVRIDCNGIAQGYTVDLIMEHLRRRGVERMVVELGGELRVYGPGPEQDEWRIGIESPASVADGFHPVEMVIGLRDRSVTSSGNYRQPGHIIDPIHGRPVKGDLVAVTVVAHDAMTADAWDNALFVMGRERALKLLRRHPELEVYMVYKDERGRYRDTATAGFIRLKR